MKQLLLKYSALFVLLAAAVASSFFLPRREPRSIGQVAGVALDRTEQGVRATFELYDPSLEEPIGKKRRTVVTEGADFQDCIDQAVRKEGERLYTDDLFALILSGEEDAFLLDIVLDHYRLLKNDHMALPVFFTLGQQAGAVFDGEGAVLSMDLAESGKRLKKIQTVRDLMNGAGTRVVIRGEGSYEIVS